MLFFRRFVDERGAAAAGALGAGIFEAQAVVHEAIVPVHLGAVDVEVALFIDEDAHLLGFELEVEGAFAGFEVEGVGEAGAATAFDADADGNVFGEPLFGLDAADGQRRFFGEVDHGCVVRKRWGQIVEGGSLRFGSAGGGIVGVRRCWGYWRPRLALEDQRSSESGLSLARSEGRVKRPRRSIGSCGRIDGDDRSDSASRMISGDRWGRTGDHTGGSCVSGKRLGRSIGSCGWIASEILREIMPVTPVRRRALPRRVWDSKRR